MENDHSGKAAREPAVFGVHGREGPEREHNFREDFHHRSISVAPKRKFQKNFGGAEISAARSNSGEDHRGLVRTPIAMSVAASSEPKAREGVRRLAYDGVPDRQAFDRLNTLIGDAPFHVELGRVYRLDEAERAHREIREHHLGKLALRLRAA
jgi:hypothetical protein